MTIGFLLALTQALTWHLPIQVSPCTNEHLNFKDVWGLTLCLFVCSPCQHAVWSVI
eukprot:m.227571 g.227571  ORF g.227571 m.227571 type:complete len:56 (+) comp40039_c1_seq19:1411-1578(+)